MPTRIVHISDLHFPARQKAQPAVLAETIHATAPDIVVVSGDLTRRGAEAEFSQAADFIEVLPGAKLVVPGNHDAPIAWERLTRPFGRFERHFGRYAASLETPDVFLQGFNTAVGAQLSLDWSLGRVPKSSLDRIVNTFRDCRGERLKIAVCHHPLRSHALDERRSRTQGGPAAFAALAAAGVDLVLHGHLHRESCTCMTSDGRQTCEICANTALSDRERAGTSGFNVLDVAGRSWKLTKFYHVDGRYRPRPAEPAAAETSQLA